MKKAFSFLLIWIASFLLAQESFQVDLLLATTEKERQTGLMEKNSLENHQGLLMDFETNSYPVIWAKKTPIHLDVAFLDERGLILAIFELKAHPEWNQRLKENPYDETEIDQLFLKESVKSPKPCRYVIEMNAGWFKERTLLPGDRLLWSQVSRKIKLLEVFRQTT